MCIVASPLPAATPAPVPSCPAKGLDPDQRQRLALATLAGTRSVQALAAEYHVSRKFVYQLADQANRALRRAFAAPGPLPEERVLFYLPVTKTWLRQLVLALVLICHCPLRGVVELLADLFDYSLSLGTVHSIVHSAVPLAAAITQGQNLANVRVAALDEIFQASRPVLVGCDADSTFCFLLSLEQGRDGDTWGVRLLEGVDRGLAPEATIADGGTGLRAGHEVALPDVPCRGDVFHALMEVRRLVRHLESRAYEAIATRSKLQAQLARPGKWRDRRKWSLIQKLRFARVEEAAAIAVADDVALLCRWLREDVVAVAGLDYAGRCELYDFVVSELRARHKQCPHRIGPVVTLLENQRDHLLAFVRQLDSDLTAVAAAHEVSEAVAREALQVEAMSSEDVRRVAREAALWGRLGGRYHRLREAVREQLARVVRASSVVENLNSRLRNYFFLRRQLGPDYLSLLQFFLNHRRLLRSEHPQRAGKSPAELLTGQPHPHWLEMLGYQRFRRAG
jgi:hypothetical protein